MEEAVQAFIDSQEADDIAHGAARGGRYLRAAIIDAFSVGYAAGVSACPAPAEDTEVSEDDAPSA